MRLSTIFELLLILLLVAFAAYGRVIDHDEMTHRVTRAADNTKQSDMDLSTMSLKQATDSVNRYCTCNENICNCCRDFHIPVVQLKGPGCASLQYLQGDNLAVQLSFGDNILTSTIVNGKSPKPVCVPLPGGFTKFCGRIYSIQRDAKNHFKACLGLELQSATELEASLRVSCFRFGPEGLKLRPAEPLPVVEAESVEEDSDDDDDFFGLGSDDDDDDDEEDDSRPSLNSVPDASGISEAQEPDDDDDDDDDLLGFSALLDIFTGEEDTATKRPKLTTAAPLLEFTIPILSRPTTPTLLEDPELPTFPNNESENNDEEHEDGTQEPGKVVDGDSTGTTESNNTENNTDENQELVTESSNKVTYFAKPNKVVANNVKKGEKKPSVTSTSVNAIHDLDKPSKKPKPIKDPEYEDDDDILDDDDDLDADDDDEALDDDDEDKNGEEEDNEGNVNDEKHEEHYDDDDDDDDDDDEKAEDLAELDDDDDDDEEEEAMLSALMDSGKSKKNKGNETSQINDDKHDYAELDFLAKKHADGNRQSKVTRF